MWSELYSNANQPSEKVAKKLKASFVERCHEAAKAVKNAEVLLVVTGAGFSADSGLAVYNDVARVPAYQQRDLDYADICAPDWLLDNPDLFYGFWGQCFNDYRATEPHQGYHILAKWKDDKNTVDVAKDIQSRIARKVQLRRPFDDEITLRNSPYETTPGQYAAAFFSFTSNVDAHWFDILEAHEIHECHGNIETWQCSDPYCTAGLWRAPRDHSFEVCQKTMLAPFFCSADDQMPTTHAQGRVPTDGVAHIGQTIAKEKRKNVLRYMPEGKNKTGWMAEEIRTCGDASTPPRRVNHPRCNKCGELARPAILMFGDFGWKRDIAQGERWSLWKESVLDLCERRNQSNPLKICIIEIGCGLNVPTCRGASERMVLEAQRKGGDAQLIRVNRDYPLSADEEISECLIPIMSCGMDALTHIDGFYRGMTKS